MSILIYNHEKVNEVANYNNAGSVYISARNSFIIYNGISIFLTVLPCHPVRMGNKAFLGHFIYRPHYANGLHVTQRDRCNMQYDE